MAPPEGAPRTRGRRAASTDERRVRPTGRHPVRARSFELRRSRGFDSRPRNHEGRCRKVAALALSRPAVASITCGAGVDPRPGGVVGDQGAKHPQAP